MSYKADKEICPLVKTLHDDCYCFNLNSRNINSAIYYCSNNFHSCNIFRKKNTPGENKKSSLKEITT